MPEDLRHPRDGAPSTPRRRALLHGIGWTLPAAVVTAAAPAFAASSQDPLGPGIHSALTAELEEVEGVKDLVRVMAVSSAGHEELPEGLWVGGQERPGSATFTAFFPPDAGLYRPVWELLENPAHEIWSQWELCVGDDGRFCPPPGGVEPPIADQGMLPGQPYVGYTFTYSGDWIQGSVGNAPVWVGPPLHAIAQITATNEYFAYDAYLHVQVIVGEASAIYDRREGPHELRDKV